MFLTEAKTLFVEAMSEVFSETFPIPKFRDIYVSMEFPEDKANYPGIWVDFTPTTAMQSAGIGHVEYIPVGDNGDVRKGTVWRFAGEVSFTIAAMTSLERDTLIDEVIRLLAFGAEEPALSAFRTKVERNDLIKVSMQWDTFALSGKGEQPGTPWGTDEIIYEMTVTIDCQGQFVSGFDTSAILVPLHQIQITGSDEHGSVRTDTPSSSEPNSRVTDPAPALDNLDWH